MFFLLSLYPLQWICVHFWSCLFASLLCNWDVHMEYCRKSITWAGSYMQTLQTSNPYLWSWIICNNTYNLCLDTPFWLPITDTLTQPFWNLLRGPGQDGPGAPPRCCKWTGSLCKLALTDPQLWWTPNQWPSWSETHKTKSWKDMKKIHSSHARQLMMFIRRNGILF